MSLTRIRSQLKQWGMTAPNVLHIITNRCTFGKDTVYMPSKGRGKGLLDMSLREHIQIQAKFKESWLDSIEIIGKFGRESFRELCQINVSEFLIALITEKVT